MTVDYRFRFVGLEREDETTLATLRKQEVETRMTINELREEDGLKPLDDDYANVVLNPQSVQIYMGDKAAKAQAEQQAQGGDQGYDEYDPNADEEVSDDGEDSGESTEVDWEQAFSKSMNSGRKTVRVIIK